MSGWERTPNAVLADGLLSARAIGVFILLRQRQGVGAPMGSAVLSAGRNREGRDAMRAAYRELEAAGFLHQLTIARGRNTLRTLIRVYDVPVTAETAQLDMLARLSGPDIPSSKRPVSGPDFSAPKNPAPSPTEIQTNYNSAAGQADWPSGPENPSPIQRPLYPAAADAPLVPAPLNWRQRHTEPVDVPHRRQA